MKPEFLGDSKDCFKWDYHDYLTSKLGYSTLNVVLMLTGPGRDNSKHGKTDPKRFLDSGPVVNFCLDLKKQPDIQLIRRLPAATGSMYRVELHKPGMDLTSRNRTEYFSDICAEEDHVLFLDPDNGFEPEKSHCEKHVLYSDVETILKQISETTVVSVFQDFRRISFDKDFARIQARIQERIPSGYATALHWHSLMFVAIAKKQETIGTVEAINRQYAQSRPVTVLQ